MIATDIHETYAWDHRDQLTRAEKRTAANALVWSVAYRHDALGRLIERAEDANGDGTAEKLERFVHDLDAAKGGLDDLLLTFDGSGNVTHRYLSGPEVDQVFADEDNLNGILWGLSDREGTLGDWVKRDGGGNNVNFDRIEFDARGKVVSRTNANHTGAPGYEGRVEDPLTGLRHHRGRWDDPATGWVSPDPIGFEAGDPNLYRVVGNATPNASDPSGLAVWDWDWSTFGTGYANNLNPWSSKAQPANDTFGRCIQGGQKVSIVVGGTAGAAAAGLGFAGAAGITTAGSTTISLSGVGSVIATETVDTAIEEGLSAATGTVVIIPASPVDILQDGGKVVLKKIGKEWSSPDPFVASVANKIECRYPGHVKGVNVPVNDPLTGFSSH